METLSEWANIYSGIFTVLIFSRDMVSFHNFGHLRKRISEIMDIHKKQENLNDSNFRW